MTKPGAGWANRHKLQLRRKEMSSSFCLCTSEELPAWHFKHRGLHYGFRYCETFYEALWSLFYWHNESVNIWSHYIATIALIFFSISTLNIRSLDTQNSTVLIDTTIIFSTVIMGNIVPIILSAFCHHFYCVNKEWHTLCWFLDFIGILTGELCGGISFIYLAFYCNKYIVWFLIYLIVVGYILTLQWCWRKYSHRVSSDWLFPHDRIPEFSKYLSGYGFFASVVPLVVSSLLNREYMIDSELFIIFVCSCVGPVLMALGIVVFAQGHVPERFAVQWQLPKHYFDFIGHSHQMWHFVSASLMFGWIAVLAKHYEARIAYGCPTNI